VISPYLFIDYLFLVEIIHLEIRYKEYNGPRNSDRCIRINLMIKSG